MRQNAAVTVNPPTRQERLSAFKLVGLQALAAVLVAVAWCFGKDIRSAGGAILGGLACVIPSLLFTWRLFVNTSPRAAKTIALVFYLGEFVKLILSALAVALLVLVLPNEMLAVITGFVGAQFGFWLVPLLGRV